MRRLIVGTIVLDALALLVFLVSFAYARIMLPLAANMQVIALDRAEVFREDKLREFAPGLAENLRHNLGPFITQDYQRAIERLLVLAIALTVAHLVVLRVVRRSIAKAQAGAPGRQGDLGPPGTPAARTNASEGTP